MKPLVSIIVPLYNYEKYITNCIRSIKKQDYDNYEIIVVDDHSSDNSYKIAKRFESNKIHVISIERNKGYSNAKNEGIIASKGKFIIILDADDMLTKNSISIRVDALLKNNVPFVHGNAISVYGEITLNQCYKLNPSELELFTYKNHLKKKNMILSFPTPYAIHAQTVMLDRDLHKTFGLYDEKLRSRSDREMWWRFFGQSDNDIMKINKCFVNETVAYYRYHKKSMSRKRQKNSNLDKNVRALSEKIYQQRKNEGITKENTMFLERVTNGT